MRLLLFLVICLACVTLSECSVGDRSYVFQKCVNNCNHYNCTGDRLRKFSDNQLSTHRLLQWMCTEECRYTCMWITVDAFQRDGLNVPQFNGKWPFVRMFGIQEPASMIFSVLNGLAHLGIFWYRKHIPSTTPMYYIWHGASLTAMNAWFWSAIFHSRDTPFTEKMDYFSAFSIILYNTFTLSCRILGTVRWWRPFIVGVSCTVFFIQHVTYLASLRRFDYGYNMKVQVGVAIFNMIGWLSWCIYIRRNRYVWKAVVSILGIQMLLSLELWDFPPIYWTFDAHSLWHGGSWPLAILWYSLKSHHPLLSGALIIDPFCFRAVATSNEEAIREQEILIRFFVIDDGRTLMKNKEFGVLPQTTKID